MECDDDDMMQVMSDMPGGGVNGQNPIVTEAKAVYKQLRTLCGTLKNSHDDDSGELGKEWDTEECASFADHLSYRSPL